MPSAFLSGLSRVVSPNRTHVFGVVLLLEVGGGGWEVAEGGGGVRCNRLVTSVSELALGPLPCQLSPGGDAFGALDLGWVIRLE